MRYPPTSSHYPQPGERYSRWVVTGPAYPGARGCSFVPCRCDCGTEREVNGLNLKRGLTRSCGCYQPEARREQALTSPDGAAPGSRFTSWVVVGPAFFIGRKKLVACKCNCGTTRALSVAALKGGLSRSCGCLQRPPREVAFWQKVQKSEGGCWLWQGKPRADGYGRLQAGGKCYGAHRVSWELHFGPIPAGQLVCHRCDTPMCVRPDHLFLGTIKDNQADMVAKGRSAAGMRNWVAQNPESSRGENNGRAKLTETQAREIRRRCQARETIHKNLAAEYGVTPSTIGGIARRRLWKHLEE